MKRRRLLGLGALFATASSWVGLLKAQSEGQALRAVIIRRSPDSGAELPFRETESISLKIKNFRPEDAGRFTYYVAEVRKSGSGWSSAWPDQEGTLTRTRTRRPEDDSSHPTQYYYFTVDNVIGEKRYTFDFQDISLVSLVRSLSGSLRTHPRGERPARPSRPLNVLNDPAAEFVTISAIQGEDLTLTETLDRIREVASCDVIQAEDALIIDWCG